MLAALLVYGCLPASAQVVEFEAGGLNYQTQSRSGVTVMFAHLPSGLKSYSILQVAVSNGSRTARVFGPEDCRFVRPGGAVLRGSDARSVVNRLIDHGSRNDVIKLVAAYEAGLYGMTRFQSTNGYELRRQAALAEVQSTRLKAAAAASAIALVDTRLAPGESTDGAVFFPWDGKPLGPGRLIVRVGSDSFEFDSEAEGSSKTLLRR
jgi:hypothetical protein